VKPIAESLRPYRARFERDLTTALHQQEKSAVAGHLIVASLVTALLYSELPLGALGGWMGAIFAACAFRAWAAWNFSRLKQSEVRPQDQWMHMAGVLACGLAWGFGYVLLIPQLDSMSRAIVLMVLSGLSSAAVVTLSARVTAFASFACALLLPACISFAVRGQEGEFILAGLAIACLAFGFASAFKARHLLWSHLLESYRAEDALQNLSQAKERLSKALKNSESASQAKSEFLANMSHEVRTPMNGVLGMAELIGQTDLKEDQQELLAILQSSGRDLMAILDNVLDLSKIEGDRYEFVHEAFDLHQLLDELATRTAIESEEKRLEFVYDAAADLPVQVVGDPNRTRQLIQNLLENAVKFTERGVVSFHAKAYRGGPQGTTLELVMRDQGKGIAAEQLESVFESFNQGDNSSTRSHGGTGLGLTISRRLVELMGGTIEVESELGKGTSFKVKLPFETQHRPQATIAAQNACLVGPQSASLVNLRERLTRMGMTVNHVHTREELEHQKQDGQAPAWLIISPDEDRELLQGARQLAAQHRAQLVAITAIGAPAPESGEWKSLSRPFKLARLQHLFTGTESSSEEPATQAASDSQVGGLDILVAEDNPTNARIAQRMLEQFGMRVTIAKNGREAVEKFAASAPHLIFMDVQMPELDGMQATEEIRKLPGGSDVPIIALTAHAMKGYREKCIEAGMNDYFTKPLRRADLNEALQRWQNQAVKRKRA